MYHFWWPLIPITVCQDTSWLLHNAAFDSSLIGNNCLSPTNLWFPSFKFQHSFLPLFSYTYPVIFCIIFTSTESSLSSHVVLPICMSYTPLLFPAVSVWLNAVNHLHSLPSYFVSLSSSVHLHNPSSFPASSWFYSKPGIRENCLFCFPLLSLQLFVTRKPAKQNLLHNLLLISRFMLL